MAEPLDLRSLLLLTGLQARAVGAQGIRASVDQPEARVGDRIRLTLTVQGSSRAEPQLPDLSPFDAYSQGQSTQVQIVNGRMTTSIAHNYVLIAKKPGKYTLGPASVNIDGRIFSSKPLTIRVLDTGKAPATSRDIFVTTRVSNKKPYVGEQIIYTLRFYQRVQTQRVTLEQQEFNGFTSHDLGEQRTYTTTVDGMEYRVTELRRALFGQEVGKRTLPGAAIEAEIIVRSRQRRRGVFDDLFDSPFDGFFGRQAQPTTVRSAPIEVTVASLPPAPPGFSGLVGEFEIAASLSRKEVPVGESTTLTMTVSGKGNATGIGEPPISGLEHFKIYDDKPTSNVAAGARGVAGSKTFRKALVPLSQGDLSIPAIALTYFDPVAKHYRTARSRPLTLTATAPTGEEDLRLAEFRTPTSGKVAVKVLAEDILPIYRKVDALAPQGLMSVDRFFFGGALLLPALGFVGLFAFHRRRERLAVDSGLRRRRRAAKRAHRTLKVVAKAERAGQHDQAAEAASRAVRELIGDMLNLEGGALTPGETVEQLDTVGVAADITADVETLLRSCDTARYSGIAKPSEPDGLGQRVGKLLRRLSRELARMKP